MCIYFILYRRPKSETRAKIVRSGVVGAAGSRARNTNDRIVSGGVITDVDLRGKRPFCFVSVRFFLIHFRQKEEKTGPKPLDRSTSHPISAWNVKKKYIYIPKHKSLYNNM